MGKNKKTGALAFGILMEMVMPDFYTERTIKIVQEDKNEHKQQRDENGEI